MDSMMLIRAAVGLVIIAVAGVLALKRAWFLQGLIRSGQPAVGRTDQVSARVQVEATEVLGQKKLLKWSVPGIAHVFVFFGFLILTLTVVEAFGELFIADFAFPIIGTWPVVRFLEDLFAVLVVVGILVFALIRFRNNPAKDGRRSRFFGSHTSGAWLVLFLIFMVVATLLLYRGAKINAEGPEGMDGAFASHAVAAVLEPLGETANEWLLTLGLWAHVSVILGFLLLVLHSKHLHIFAAPINVYFSRRPDGLGPLLEMYSAGEKIDFEDPADDAVFGAGRIEDFTWKGLLDMATCTECGRCQSQCPAWNTEKPLSPKLMIMDLRDHAFTKAPYIKATQAKLDGKNVEFGEVDDEVLATMSERVQAEVGRPLIGERDFDPHRDTDGYDASGHRSHEGPVIDVDALWSCTTCGACVNQCPVDIEHIDHFIDMRRHQVMIATEFPTQLNSLFKNIESKGNPWGMNASKRNDWISEVDFEVPVFGAEGEDEIPADVEYLFWVGCAGAYEDRAKQTTKDVAELLNVAGVKYMVLGEGETCTGDPARRAGNEFLFQMQAMQNVEVLNEVKAKRIVVTCPHCMNTIGREYPQLGGDYEVVHHSQLLATLLRDGRLKPLTPVDSTVTYHDPCYLGRHNKVYVPPRELVASVPGVKLVEMERTADMSFCCGAGGAQMWMEERLGTRVNQNRADEAIGTGADKIAVACPFCSVMLHDGVTVRAQEAGEGATPVEVIDVASLLLGSVRAPAND
ncbi:MAG TPA: 4Fe-4S dicluster domain-containing protein [Motilibacterales bacterium]|nr:4Fe-4S dicluster domain-containing protein [Motilibacterales bacterium]